MKKIKIASVVATFFALFIVFSLVGKVNAADENYTVKFGEVKNEQVKTTVTFNSELASDYTPSNGWTKVDSKTLEATKVQFGYYSFTVNMKDGTQETVRFITPFEMKKGETMSISKSDIVSEFDSVKITSDNSKILKVNEDEKSFTAMDAGTANITVTATKSGTTGSLSCKGTVVANEEKTEEQTTQNTGKTSGNLEWTDFSNFKIEWKDGDEQFLSYMIKVSNDKKIATHKYHIYIKSDKSAPNIKISGDYNRINEEIGKNDYYGELTENTNRDIMLIDLLERNNKSLYITVVEEQYTEDFKYTNKIILSKEFKRPEELKVGNRMKCFFFKDKTDTFLYYTSINKYTSKINLKLGKITDNSILRNIRDAKAGALQDLLKYAKENKNPIYTGTVKVGKDKEITSGMNLVDDEYYYVYMELEDEDGKYYPIEDVSLYQALVGDTVGKNLFDYLSNEFKWNIQDDTNESNEEGQNRNEESNRESEPATAPTRLPQTGMNQTAIIAIVTVSCIAICGYIGYRKYRDIK